MNVLGRVSAQDLESLMFVLGIARSDPLQQPAVVEVLIEMPGVLRPPAPPAMAAAAKALGSVESSQQQVVDGSLEGLNIVEDCNGFRLARTVVRIWHGRPPTSDRGRPTFRVS